MINDDFLSKFGKPPINRKKTNKLPPRDIEEVCVQLMYLISAYHSFCQRNIASVKSTADLNDTITEMEY